MGSAAARKLSRGGRLRDRPRHRDGRAVVAIRPPGQQISIARDSIFSIPDIIKRGDHSGDFQAFCRKWGLTGPYLIVQPSDALWRRKGEIGEYLHKAKAKGWHVLELPIGFGIGNYTGFYRDGVTVRPTEWPEPLLLAEIIANAEAVLGVSLHLSVVASCYGIPVYRPRYSRTSKFVVLDGLPNVFFLEDKPELRGREEIPADCTLVDRYRSELDEHWQRLAALASRDKTPEPLRARAAWPQMCLTPDAFRHQRGTGDRWMEIAQGLRRQRQFVMHSLRKRARSRTSER